MCLRWLISCLGINSCWKADTMTVDVDGLSSSHVLPWCMVLSAKSCGKLGVLPVLRKVLWQPTKQDVRILLHVDVCVVKRTVCGFGLAKGSEPLEQHCWLAIQHKWAEFISWLIKVILLSSTGKTGTHLSEYHLSSPEVAFHLPMTKV